MVSSRAARIGDVLQGQLAEDVSIPDCLSTKEEGRILEVVPLDAGVPHGDQLGALHRQSGVEQKLVGDLSLLLVHLDIVVLNLAVGSRVSVERQRRACS